MSSQMAASFRIERVKLKTIPAYLSYKAENASMEEAFNCSISIWSSFIIKRSAKMILQSAYSIFTKIVKLVNFPTGHYSVHQKVTMKGMEKSRMKPMPPNMQQITVNI